MLKMVSAIAVATFLTASSLASAEMRSASVPERMSTADLNKLTDLRIDLIKGALQLTPDQAKLWPAVENALRIRATNRHARITKIVETVGQRADESPIELLRNRDPITFLQRRADALEQRSADLKRLAEAWQPLYRTFSSEQRTRMATLTLFVLRDMSDALEQRRAQIDDDDD
jgi:hypothetical protein